MVYIVLGRTIDGVGGLLEFCTSRQWATIRRTRPGHSWLIVGKLAGDEAEVEWCRRTFPEWLRRSLMISHGRSPVRVRLMVLYGLETAGVAGLPIDAADDRALGLARPKPHEDAPVSCSEGLAGRLARRRATGTTDPGGLNES